MAYTNHFWKQIQKQQQSKPSLSELYKNIIENQNVALYSKDIGDLAQAPDAPEGTKVLGVVSQDYLGKIKSLANLQNNQNKNLLADLFKNKANISKKYHNTLVPVIKNAVESSGYAHAAELLEAVTNSDGFFDILGDEKYNAIQAAINGITESARDLIDDNLNSFLLTILQDATKFASTNVGPGELFFVLFSNAQVSVLDGQKTGDLAAEGLSIELKSSGARMNSGRSRLANHASSNITNFLESKKHSYAESNFFEREKNKLADKIADLANPAVSIQQFIDNAKQLLEREEAHQIIFKKFDVKIFKFLKNNLLDSTPDVNWNTLVTKSGSITQRTGGRPLIYFVLDRLREIKSVSIEKEASLELATKQSPLKSESNLAYLLSNTFDVLKKSDISAITKEDILKIIYLTNSYTEEECDEFGYSIMEDLETFLGDKSVEEILNLSSGALTNLIGAMHLVCYAQEKQFDRLMFLNKVTGEAIVFQAPQRIWHGVEICRRSDITVEPYVEQAGGTIYASTSKYYFNS